MKKFIAAATALLLCFSALAGPKIVFMGDSITDGSWGRVAGTNAPAEQRNHKDKNHVFGHGYMEMVAGYYMSRYPAADYQFFNRGVSGYKLPELEKRWAKDVVEARPDVLSVLIGTNDIYNYLSTQRKALAEGADVSSITDAAFDYAAWEALYRSLLDQAVAANPHVRIVLGAPFIVRTGNMASDGMWDVRSAMTDKLAQIVRGIARDYKAVYVPFDQLFRDLYRKYDVADDYWSWDGIHPTTAAHQRMADLWVKKVGKIK